LRPILGNAGAVAAIINKVNTCSMIHYFLKKIVRFIQVQTIFLISDQFIWQFDEIPIVFAKYSRSVSI
jgi:hypothetical protein